MEEQRPFAVHTVARLANEYFGIDPEQVSDLPGEVDYNYRIREGSGRHYLLKITRDDFILEDLLFQNAMIGHIHDKNLPFKTPVLLENRKGDQISFVGSEMQTRHAMRLFEWIPGKPISSAKPITKTLLENLGTDLGKLSGALIDFQHPASNRNLKWDITYADWVQAKIDYFDDPEEKELVEYFLQLFKERVVPRLPQLRRSVIFNDANDHNILIAETGRAKGIEAFIDFGDALWAPTINDLAIACAYNVMEQPDPLDYILVITRAYHRQFPLTETEAALLFPLIAARLIISVTVSALNRKEHPENQYLQISDAGARKLLKKLRSISPDFAHYSIRQACGFEAHPNSRAFKDWAIQHKFDFRPLLKKPCTPHNTCVLDLGVGSTLLGNHGDFIDDKKFNRLISRYLEDQSCEIGIGGYLEIRPFYTADSYTSIGNNGPQWRTMHLGLDIWTEAYTTVYAPLSGKIYAAHYNEGYRDYGPTLILEHHPDDGPVFYTLFGHLSPDSLDGWKKGMPVKAGQAIAAIGAAPDNGHWPPHLHFQIILDMLGEEHNYPGVALAAQREVWASLCPDPNLLAGITIRKPDQYSPAYLQKKRKSLLAPNLSLSYRDPLWIKSGYMQYLYDHTGRRYLDTVNNVAHVGHEHPRVVEAGIRQMRVLNTNTRYLHPAILEYAEALLATLPDKFGVCYFVNSGSEANELAIRIAKTVTGRQDMLALEMGYHGNTNACIGVSSYKFDRKGGKGKPSETHIVPLPDTHAGKYRGNTQATSDAYVAEVQQLLRTLESRGKAPAGFISEGIVSCGGQVVPPPGYLRQAFQAVRDVGGLIISDEVQTGFGRIGQHFWSFELDMAMPDIVTLGKPIGNGHPMGAVITTPEIAEEFNNGMEFFSTFGGNPVSAAIGLSVLEVIHEEGLQLKALETGEYLQQQLRQLQGQHSIISDIRGHGLFLGIALTQEEQAATPQAAYITNRMRQLGILMSTDGPYNNILKIKPPMCFDTKDADFLVETLDQALGEL